MSNVDLAAELDRFREKLLDTTNRNPLLNYRKSRRRTLEIVDELPDQVFQRLVADGKRFRFYPQPEEKNVEPALALAVYDGAANNLNVDGNGALAGSVDSIPADDSRYFDDRLQTNLSEERLESVLKSMSREAVSAIEETGVNYLFLAIGMLEWHEREDSEKAHLAPLILIPVALDRSFDGRSLKYEYCVSCNGEELQYNLCLAKRLQKDFGIRLPEHDGEQSPEAYFAEVEKAVASQLNWSVRPQQLIGFFSFQKMLMYLDLDPATWRGHAALYPDSIAGQLIAGREIETGSHLYAQDYNIDHEDKDRKIALVTDADSSQHSALLDVSNGKNLVIEGPPGTGKSQTITNAIAAAIREGKNVLFVAEKLAALRVVSDRLRDLGLSKLCLELHSDGGPKHVYASLKERMNAGFSKPRELQAICNDLDRRKRALAAYLAATSQPVGPYSNPLYEVMWRTIELRSRGIRSGRHLGFDARVGRSKFDENAQLLEAFTETLKEVERPRQSPWWGFWVTEVNPNDLEPIAELLTELLRTAKSVQSLGENLRDHFGEGLLQWLTDCKEFDATIFESLSSGIRKLKVIGDLSTFLEPQLAAAARDLARSVVESRNLLAQSSTYISDDRTAAEKTTQELQDLLPDLRSTVDNATVGQLRGLKAKLGILRSVLAHVEGIADVLRSQGLGPARNIREYQHSEELFRLLRHTVVSSGSELPPSLFLSKAPSLWKQSKLEAERLLACRDELGKAFDWPSLPAADEIQRVARRLRLHADRWLRFLSKDFRSAKRELIQFSRSGIGRTPHEWVANLEKLEDHLAAERRFHGRIDLKATFGDLFQGLDTEWEQAHTLLQWAATVVHRGLDPELTNQLLKKRTDNDLRGHQVIEARQQLLGELSQSEVLICLGAEAVPEIVPFSEIRRRSETLLSKIHDFEQLAAPLLLTEELTLQDIAGRLEVIDKARRLRDHCVYPEKWSQLGTWYQALDTDCNNLVSAIDWVEAVQELTLPGQAESCIVESSADSACSLFAYDVQALQNDIQKWHKQREQLSAFGRMEDTWLNLIDCDNWTVVAAGQIDRLLKSIDTLPAWAAFSRVLLRCDAEQLLSFTDLAFENRVELDQLADCYRLSVFERTVEAELAASPELKGFSRQTLEKAREFFRQLDKQLLQQTREQVAYDASRRRTPMGTSRGRVAELTEMGLIRHEVQKQKRFCRIRELLLRAGNAVQGLKPCFMMSPLSVAQYLAPEGIDFDLVIMDEASQIKPEDALGTVLRAKQLVVVGDPKQLPPTSFFDRTEDEVSDEEATQIDNAESVLEVAMKSFQPVRRLRWHYRSQHESLIHFSNDRFYDRDLIVFPSATGCRDQLGLRFHHIANGNFDSGCNLEEAKVVAAAIVEHAKRSPDETLGVGTFNLKQRELIDELLEKTCEKDAESRTAIDRLNEHPDKLFIKNLENLQGDERDVIFISYTYGHDPDSGKVLNRFGPITGGYGWRRLNVLITRARRRVEVFTSMLSSEILGGPSRSLGVNAMKDYLEYVKTGLLPDRGLYSGRSPDSPFEISVGRVVTRMGLQVVPQVGVAGCFIDLGVLHPNGSGDFLLGIECDGATYHSAKSARDRDRLRQEVIQKRGWRLHRIWSTDWFLNQKHEEERLIRVLEELLGQNNGHPR